MKSALGRVLNDTQQSVEQRLSRINLAQVIADLRGDVRGGLRVIRSGLSPNDRVIIEKGTNLVRGLRRDQRRPQARVFGCVQMRCFLTDHASF
jgi:hypothetical protein